MAVDGLESGGEDSYDEEEVGEELELPASPKGLAAPFPSAGSRTTGSDNETKAYAQRSDF